MTNYAKGVRAEKKTRTWMESQGLFVVEARGSHGACDLVGLSAAGVVAVQVKSGRTMGPKEREQAVKALRSIPVPEVGGHRWLVTWKKYSRDPQVEEV